MDVEFDGEKNSSMLDDTRIERAAIAGSDTSLNNYKTKHKKYFSFRLVEIPALAVLILFIVFEVVWFTTFYIKT